MIPKEKVIAGAAMYIEREVLPHLPELKALAVAGVVALYSRKAPELLDKLESVPAVKVLGVMDGGMVDADALYSAFAPNITKPIEISIPFVGSLSFDRAEADKLLRYIKEA